MISHCQIYGRVVIFILNIPFVHRVSCKLQITDDVFLNAQRIVWYKPKLVESGSDLSKILDVEGWSLSNSPLSNHIWMGLGVIQASADIDIMENT